LSLFGWEARRLRGAIVLVQSQIALNTDKATILMAWRLQNARNTFVPVFMKENDTCAGRWYYFGEHFYVQFRVHILHTAQTEIISLMCVCTVMWSNFR
jgi:hypothetical protein